ncbi:DMT family transporter [Microcella sp.]|uniref:DMT family transporter n=1 Tax=Microcella sp. TaxID=1913979 RepID=UPI00391B413F
MSDERTAGGGDGDEAERLPAPATAAGALGPAEPATPARPAGGGRASGDLHIALQFTAAGVVWGASFLFIAVGLEGLSPAQIATGRTVFGALTLGVIVLVTREKLPREWRIWAHMTVVALTLCVFPYLLFGWAQQSVSSGLASVYNATTPLMTALMAGLVIRVERLTREQILGLVVGLAGVLVIIAPWAGVDLRGGVVPQLALLGATACYGFSLAYLRRFLQGTGLSGVMLALLNVGIAAVIMLAVTPIIGTDPITLDIWIVGSIVLLGVFGTGLAYAWNQNVVRAWGATRAATVTYISPVVGVALGILVLGEVLVWNEPVGAALIFLGILLAQRRLRLPRRPR